MCKFFKQIPPKFLGIALSLDVLIFDQLTKYLVLEHMQLPPSGQLEVLPFFNLTLVYNKGISFGMLRDLDARIPLMVFTMIICSVLITWLFRTKSRFDSLCIGLILGGAVGNLIDRARFGSVVDFIDLHAAGFHYPAFNIADSAIVIGALLIIFKSFFVKEEA